MALDVEDDLRVQELRGLDQLDTFETRRPLGRRVWDAAWPKLAALALALAGWQALAATGWKAEAGFSGPGPVAEELWATLTNKYADNGLPTIWEAIRVTMTRGIVGFLLATVVGLLLGVAVSQSRVLRAAIGSLITGLQTMPSIAWFPLALLLFGIDESAILFVILIGSVPSIANGVISGVDYVPPLLVRAGRNLGAGRVDLYRHVIVPAALPSIVSGLKQGWAFSWRSLLAGELLVAIANRPSLGQFLQASRETQDTNYMIALMIIILAIGILVDVVFNAFDNRLRRRRGVSPQP
ncbi:ABC transporter permease [Luteipulveratus mongoliensis]|uniref:ABC transporter permease n=1 Tax=Luteipulveratus mongoliensis TaxID=571913 RepID=A0A0K1JNJ8_9MICO|nr:ABC transporter permease [Luteipulveratus mongoliensis]AKU18289.1 ABC transporter permease [Luteipulveratus mongoliensis]